MHRSWSSASSGPYSLSLSSRDASKNEKKFFLIEISCTVLPSPSSSISDVFTGLLGWVPEEVLGEETRGSLSAASW